MIKQRLTKIFGEWVLDVNARSLRVDMTAGLLGAVLVLPQAIAFAMLAGLPAEYGLYTAIIPCIIAALFGSSRHVMSGPTNANSLALFAMLTPLAVAGSSQYIQLALIVTVLVGLIQAAIGLLKLGSLANFISPAVLGGFTSGAAMLIAVHAIGSGLGISDASVHGTWPTLQHYVRHIDQVHWGTLIVALLTGIGALLVKRFLGMRWPFMLVGLIAGAVAGVLLNLTSAELGLTGVEQVGDIPSPWPAFHIPAISWQQLPDLVGIAFALSIVALGQTISIAKALATRSGQVIDPNREFTGQGLSNMVGGFFSSYVSCGSLNRSLPNLEAGAKTPLSSVASALLLMVLIALFHNLLAYIPVPGISALLILVAWSLFDIRRWKSLWQLERVEFLIAASTAIATVAIRMEVAILLGTLLSLLLYLNRTSKPAVRPLGFTDRSRNRQLEEIGQMTSPSEALQCPQLAMIRMEGDIYFGATAHVSAKLNDLRNRPDAPKHLLIMSRSMNFIDLAGAELWEQERQSRKKMGGDLYFHRPRNDVIKMWRKTGFVERMGSNHIFLTKEQAIATIFSSLDHDICRGCNVRAFRECAQIPFEPSQKS
ncbi:SulP family inorganic anion transporter [Orrella marina]|uniref:Sulfate transporter n=1 Tax=Orrella marina TaxID=2163011 RepID=A0A2R4XIX6_9BURK|nr:SulP family inorganic anion transporter [Orrella marina]AWB33703.1 sulfate transporter [Orrella marina]